jgi:hypothetical protein
MDNLTTSAHIYEVGSTYYTIGQRRFKIRDGCAQAPPNGQPGQAKDERQCGTGGKEIDSKADHDGVAHRWDPPVSN